MNDNRKRRQRRRNRRRNKRRKLEEPLVDAFYAATESHFMQQLPSNCIQRIFSFLTYHKVSQLRQVSKAFNDVGKQLLNKKQREVEFVLKTEMARVETRSLFSINARTSEDMLRFLTTLHQAFENCTITYLMYADCFVAGKLLDQIDSLLKDHNSTTMLPYVPERVYDQKFHPFLGPFIKHSDNACSHFQSKILGKFINRDFNVFQARCELHDLEVDNLREQNKMKMLKTELLRKRRQKMDCGIRICGEFLKVMVKLRDNVLLLTSRAKKVDQKVERLLYGKDLSDNCLLSLSSPSAPPFGKREASTIPKKKVSLSTLPSSCVTNIVFYLDCDKMAQLRSICTSFNETCKQAVTQELEKVKRKVQFEIKYNEQNDLLFPSKIHGLETHMLKDLREFLQLCDDIYKLYLGAGYFFIAGKVVDEAKSILVRKKYLDDPRLFLGLIRRYNNRPHCALFRLMDLVYKAVAHFKFTIVPSTQKKTYAQDYMVSGEAHFEEEKQSKLEEIDRSIRETEVKIQDQNERKRNSVRIISGLKKKIFLLNKEICEKMNVCKQLE